MRQVGHDRDEVDRLDRRTLLRRGGTVVAATVAGVAAMDVLGGGDAQAAAGDSLALGQSNDGGTSPTALTSAASTAATLDVGNSADHAPLSLTAQPGVSFKPLRAGELANLDGDLYYTVDLGGTTGPTPGFAYTEYTASQVVTISPQRILDTRTTAGRAHIVNATGSLDASGRLVGGHTIDIDLSAFVLAPESAFCNLAAVAPVSAGYLTLWPGGTRPATSAIDFAAGTTIANFAVTGVTSTDTLSIFANTTSHVLLDVVAFGVGSRVQINPAVLPLPAHAARKRLAARVQAGSLPDWYSSSTKR